MSGLGSFGGGNTDTVNDLEFKDTPYTPPQDKYMDNMYNQGGKIIKIYIFTLNAIKKLHNNKIL